MTEAKRFEAQACQGDLWIKKFDMIPPGLEEAQAKGADHIIAHSESGHHHVLEAATTRVLHDPQDPLTLWVQTGPQDVNLRHEKIGPSAHLPVVLKANSVFRIRRGRENWPTGWRASID